MIITVNKTLNEENEIAPETTAKVWRNIPALETETTMTIEVLEE